MTQDELEAGMRADEWPHAGSIRMSVETYKLLVRVRELDERVKALEAKAGRRAKADAE